MAEISNLPDSFLEAFRKIASLSESDLVKIQAAIGGLPPSISRRKLAKQAVAELPELGQETEDLVEALLDMESFRTYVAVPIDVFVVDLLSSKSTTEKLELSSEGSAVLRSRLEKLLALPPILIAGKAAGVLSGHDHAFQGARVYSDIRTIFLEGEKGDSPSPRAAVLIHMLKIRSVSNTNFSDFFVALDDTDLMKFINTLQRAYEKSKKLKDLIPKMGLDYIEPEQE